MSRRRKTYYISESMLLITIRMLSSLAETNITIIDELCWHRQNDAEGSWRGVCECDMVSGLCADRQYPSGSWGRARWSFWGLSPILDSCTLSGFTISSRTIEPECLSSCIPYLSKHTSPKWNYCNYLGIRNTPSLEKTICNLILNDPFHFIVDQNSISNYEQCSIMANYLIRNVIFIDLTRATRAWVVGAVRYGVMRWRVSN